jgi:hypothetical protein
MNKAQKEEKEPATMGIEEKHGQAKEILHKTGL